MSRILVIDLETTGFLQSGGKIIEVGIVGLNLETGAKKILFNELCHERPITRKEVEDSWIVKNSTITLEAIQKSKQLIHLKPTIQAILDKYPAGATAYNNAFDFGFMEDRGFVFPKKLACPMKLSTDICKIQNKNGYAGYKWPNFEEAHKYFFGETGYVEQHRGADDAFYEADLVCKLYQLGIFKI